MTASDRRNPLMSADRVDLFFWLFPFGSRINPSDRLTLFLFAMAAVLMAVGALTMAAFVRTRPIVPDEASNGR